VSADHFNVVTVARIKDVLSTVEFRDWRFVIEEQGRDTFLVIEFDGRCNVSGEPATQRSRKWRLSTFMTVSEIVQTAFLAVLTAMEHEVREQFLYAGRPIFGPHFDVQKLHALCEAPGAHDKRS
jgi:hypothetical protein